MYHTDIVRESPHGLSAHKEHILEYTYGMNIQIENSWKTVLEDEFEKPYFENLATTVREAYGRGEHIYPPSKDIFSAFNHCPFEEVKVVILGQDPYHGKGQAHGLCFSVAPGIAIPPSLQNIYKELHDDLGIPIPSSGDLTHWANQGVLLLNATLTVLASRPGSHQGMGWESFTDAVVETLSREKKHLVFMLWGKYAQEKGRVVDATKHLVLTAPHPSPLSAYTGFFGCKHFSKANVYLKKHSGVEIDWNITPQK